MSDTRPLYRLWVGHIQAYVIREAPFLMMPFGIAIIAEARPVLSAERRACAQPIVDRMNAGSLTLEEGLLELDKHAFTCGDEGLSDERPVPGPKPPK